MFNCQNLSTVMSLVHIPSEQLNELKLQNKKNTFTNFNFMTLYKTKDMPVDFYCTMLY